MFRSPEHFYAIHEFLLIGFAFIVTDHKLLVFFSCPVVTCGSVGPVAITVLYRDRRRHLKHFYFGRRPSQYRFFVGITHRCCFRQHYLQVFSIGLTEYSVAQRASDLSLFLTGNRTGDLRVQKHVKATIYTTG